jgi:hypothetical protein
MLFQLRTDNHIRNSAGLAERIQAEVEEALPPRLRGRLHRVEVYLQDVNNHKGGNDTRCAIEAHLNRHQPLAVDGRAPNVTEAVSGAVEKLRRVLEHTVGRRDDQNGRVSMSGEPT